MVFFTCNHCGASLKKDKVEKHYNLVCRNAVSVSCLDCTKDFGEKDYDAHRSCITEDEKYGGKNFVPKPSFNKGARKQEAWIELVQSIKDTEQNLSAVDREFLDGLSKHENVPQKKRKFQNFATSVFHGRFKSHVVDRIWDMMEQKKALLLSSNADKNNKNENKDTENGTTEQSSDKGVENKTSKKQKKQKREESTNDTSTESTPADSEVNGEEKLSKKEKKEKHNEENEVKLSKKERKEKRKREKLLNFTSEAPNENISAEKENEDSAEKENEDAAISDGQQLNEENVEVKLSKKEMKEKRKREKYEAELKQIENHQTEEMEVDNDEDDGKKKKKKKALKVIEVDDNTSELVQNGDVNNAKQNKKNKKQAKEENVLVEEEKLEIVEGEEETFAVLKSKQRKRQTEDDESEIPVSKKHKNIYTNGNTDLLEDHEDEKTSGKFNWQETILKVLETKGELSLKKLQKKVITEYQNSGTCRETMDKAVAKFNKKVLKIPRIKVHKEVVSLLS